jgi:hypothetical protein
LHASPQHLRGLTGELGEAIEAIKKLLTGLRRGDEISDLDISLGSTPLRNSGGSISRSGLGRGRETATYDQWLDAFSVAYDAVPGPVDEACPNYGHRRLCLVFTGDPDGAIGYAHFWCDHRLQGIGLSRTAIPDHAIVQDIRLPREQRQPAIPNYHLVR